MRQLFLLAILAAGLAGCSSTEGVNPELRKWLSQDDDVSDFSAEFEALSQSGAPALIVAVEDREQTAVFLRRVRRDGVENWISADEVSLDFRSGFLVGSRGLGGDLMTADVAQSRALVLSGRAGTAKRFHSYLGGEDQVEIRTYVCEIASRGARDVDLGKRVVATRLMQERCQGADQSFQNLYWVDPGRGEIVQSRQWAGAEIGPLASRQVLR